MAKEKKHKRCVCPLGGIIDIIGKKWALLVINAIGNNEKMRYNEIMKHLKGINPKTLSYRLKGLENAGLINKQIFAEVPTRVEYSLTEDGKDLRKAIIPLMEWAHDKDDSLSKSDTPCDTALREIKKSESNAYS